MSPPDPDDDPPLKPLMGPTFWIMLVFGFICVLAGAGVAAFLPKLLSPPPESPAAPSAPAAKSSGV